MTNIRPSMKPALIYGPPISIVHGTGTWNLDLISDVRKNIGEIGYTFNLRDGSYLILDADDYFIDRVKQKLALKRVFVEGYCLVYVNGYFPGDEWYIPLREISNVHVDFVRKRIEIRNFAGERFNLYIDEVHEDWADIIRFHIERDRKIRNNWGSKKDNSEMMIDSSQENISMEKSDENLLFII
jgi:hypothetical protein